MPTNDRGGHYRAGRKLTPDGFVADTDFLGDFALGIATDVRDFEPHYVLGELRTLVETEPVFAAQLLMAFGMMIDPDEPLSALVDRVAAVTAPEAGAA